MIAAYYRLLGAGRRKVPALTEGIAEAALPILVTTATTILAFATLIVTDITMLVQFGYAATLALTANFAATLLGIPMLLRLLPEPRRVGRTMLGDGQTTDASIRRIAPVYDFILRHRLPIGAAFAALAIASLWGWYTLRVDTDFTHYFPEDSVVRRRLRDVDQSLAGASAFFVVVDTGRENGAADPAVLKQIAALQGFLERLAGVDKTVSIVDYISQLHAALAGRAGGTRDIPDTSDVVAQHLLLMDRQQISRFLDLPASSANIRKRGIAARSAPRADA